jgi:hypothetical protein
LCRRNPALRRKVRQLFNAEAAIAKISRNPAKETLDILTTAM